MFKMFFSLLFFIANNLKANMYYKAMWKDIILANSRHASILSEGKPFASVKNDWQVPAIIQLLWLVSH